MNIRLKGLQRCLLLMALLCGSVQAEDIDIFAGTTTVDTTLPNIVFVLDNTSNWSRASQKWPGGLVQGQSEVRAIKTALAAQVGKLNVGLVEYVTGGSSADTDAGYVRHHLQALTNSSLAVLNQKLDTIYNNINSPAEKRSSSNPYGDLAWDFYNYLNGGDHSNGGIGTPASLADSNAYRTWVGSQWSKFRTPLRSLDVCADTYMIFIGNNANGNIASDDATNSAALKAAYTAAGKQAPDALAGDAGTPLGIPQFQSTFVESEPVVVPPEVVPEQVIPGYTIPGHWVPGEEIPEQIIPAQTLGPSNACWKTTEQALCTLAENTSGGRCVGKLNCACTAVSSNSNTPPGCVTTGKPANRTYRWDVVQAAQVIPAHTTDDVWVEDEWVPEEIIPGYTIPGYTIPGAMQEVFVPVPGQVDTTGGRSYNFDDWAKFLYNVGVPVWIWNDGSPTTYRVKVRTYTIDVFNKQQNGDLSALWFSAANAGHGRYFQAKNEDQLVAAINTAVGDILAVSSTFAAVTLPLSATNSTRQENQVYVGMFRPAPGKKPRWFGNLKRYRLATFFGQPELADVNLRRAINTNTGFATDCAESYWSGDSDRYWENLGVEPSTESDCQTAIDAGKEWSDLPDGPFVEKGGVAQMTREGPAGSARQLYTVKSGALALIDSTDSAALGGDAVLSYLRGDGPGVDEIMATDDDGDTLGLRPSIHGDVVHSRPVSIRFDADTVRIFYGANDGLFRAVNADTGSEAWAMMDPQHFSGVERLYNNTPLIRYEGADDDPYETYRKKQYFFDGSAGQFVQYAEPDDPNSDELGDLEFAYIFPTMRRGGRMVYGLNVTDPDAPELMWRHGCPNLDNDTGCTTGFSAVGQSWSTPVGIHVEEYPGNGADPAPLVIFGGGFDDCLNADQANYPSACSSAKGKGIYLLDAVSGSLIKYFPTDAPVITQVAPVDVDFDGMVDLVYAADVAGNLYRIRFSDLTIDLTNLTSVPPAAIVSRDDSVDEEWVIEKIAAMPGTQRRFYNSPAIGLFRGTIFVTIGSGDRERPLESNYPYAADVQNRFYVLIDSPYADYLAAEEASQEGETYTRDVIDLEGNTMFEVGTDFDTGETLEDFDGWYLDLPDRGEQVANPAAVAGGKVFFNTFQPGGESDGVCELPLGIGKAYQVPLFSPEVPEPSLLPPGFPIENIVVNTLVTEGCTEEPCEPLDPDEDECASPRSCQAIHTIIGGCSETGVCPVEPEVDPIRGRTYFTEDIDR
ncbi:MAG: hypothetical protein KDI33_20480 [Halioglobus sp.]|nr:hypothetical protein [Halioglobus sp.]